MLRTHLKGITFIGIGLCIFIAAAIFGPLRWIARSANDVSPPEPVSALASDLYVTVSVKPGRTGQNILTLRVMDTRRPAPAPIDKVLVRFSPPGSNGVDITAVAERLSEGQYQVSGRTFAVPGDWKITISVKRIGLKDAVLVVPWQVLSP